MLRTSDDEPPFDHTLDGLVTGPIEVVGCHAEGEVGDVIVAGVHRHPATPCGNSHGGSPPTDDSADMVGNEPRGGVFKHVNLLVPPTDPAADIGFIIMEPEDTPPMSGSNSMCVATVVLETGIVPMIEPMTTVTLQAPGGLVQAVARVSRRQGARRDDSQRRVVRRRTRPRRRTSTASGTSGSTLLSVATASSWSTQPIWTSPSPRSTPANWRRSGRASREQRTNSCGSRTRRPTGRTSRSARSPGPSKRPTTATSP